MLLGRISFFSRGECGHFCARQRTGARARCVSQFRCRSGRELAGKKHRSYFMWEFGKPPEVVIEIVSNREGEELERKLKAKI